MYRRFLSVAGNLPGVLLILLGPMVGVLRGDVRYPEVLISDLMNLPVYKEVFGFGLLFTAAVDIVMWVEVLRYTRSQAPPELTRPINAMLFLMVACTLPGLLMVVFFPFEEFGLCWFLHCVGAAIVFAGMAGVGFTYVTFVAPGLSKLDVVPKSDEFFRRWASILVCITMVAGAAVRPVHLLNPTSCSWTMLGVEMIFCLIGMLASVLGNWQTFCQLDRAGPGALANPQTSKAD